MKTKLKPIPISANKHELTRHGTPDFPIACYIHTFNQNSYNTIDWHWHDEFQICLTLAGSVSFRVEENLYTVHTGDGLFINSRKIHISKSHTSEPAVYLCIDFHPDFLCSDANSRIYTRYILPVMSDSVLQALPLIAAKTNHRLILSEVKKIRTLYNNKESGYELDLKISLLRLYKMIFSCLSLSGVKAGNAHARDSRLKIIISQIQTHYERHISLPMIAGAVNLSPAECSRYFKKTTGQSLFDYIILFRINKSIELLENTEMSIAEIALSVGFNSQSYYTECFREKLHSTPTEYRKGHALLRPGHILP